MAGVRRIRDFAGAGAANERSVPVGLIFPASGTAEDSVLAGR
jgi:hypothetical protein